MTDRRGKSDGTQAVEQYLERLRDDADLAARLQEIDLLRAELSAQLHEARMRGDTALCDQIQRRKRELLEMRRRIR